VDIASLGVYLLLKKLCGSSFDSDTRAGKRERLDKLISGGFKWFCGLSLVMGRLLYNMQIWREPCLTYALLFFHTKHLELYSQIYTRIRIVKKKNCERSLLSRQINGIRYARKLRCCKPPTDGIRHTGELLESLWSYTDFGQFVASGLKLYYLFFARAGQPGHKTLSRWEA
jgi:hypothetical protein